MRRFMKRLWDDDAGGIISVEMILIIAILIFGLIPGLVALRNSGLAVLATLGNLITALIPSFSFSGFQILITDGTNSTVLGQIGGISFSPTFSTLTADQITPVVLNASQVIIPPAP